MLVLGFIEIPRSEAKKVVKRTPNDSGGRGRMVFQMGFRFRRLQIATLSAMDSRQ